MRWKRGVQRILILAIMAGALTGCSASVKDTKETATTSIPQSDIKGKTSAVTKNILQPDTNEKYQYANDGAVYVDAQENYKIEQWSLEGTLQQTYILPTKKDAYEELLYVNNEELFYCIQEEPGNAIQIMRVPIRQTEGGQELLLEQQESFRKVPSLADYGGDTLGNAFYANQEYIVWLTSDDTAKKLHVYDRRAEEDVAIIEDSEIAENKELEYYLSDAVVSVCSNVCGNRIIFNTDSLDKKEEKYGLSIYSFGEAKAERIDARCYTNAAYIANPNRQKVYYQITENQSVWEYDCESGEKRELIPEETFRNCYEKEGLEWFPGEDNDSFFLQGDILYIIKEKSPSDGPKVLSYSLTGNALQYERAVTEELHQCVEKIRQENGADRYYHSAIVILEGKLLYYTDYEQYYCIDLEKASTKRVYADDAEKLYFELLGIRVEAEKD